MDIRHEFKQGKTSDGEAWWSDEWWGPGGHLIVNRIMHPYVDHLETLYRPDGTIAQAVGLEGADYMLLPELKGEDA